MQIQRASLASLKFWPKNARLHGPENLGAIKASLSRFGQAEPLVVQASSRQVIGGNGRLAAMRELGWGECDVVEVDLDDAKAAALALALNRTADLADWDEPLLAEVLMELQSQGELDGVGFSDDDIDELLQKLEDEALVDGDLDDPGPGVPPATPTSRPGDLWILGEHRLLCGDSTNAGDIARVMNMEKVDLVVTSPPYNCNKDYGTHDDSMPEGEYLAFVEAVMVNCAATLKAGRVLAWNVGVSPASLPFAHAAIAHKIGLVFFREVIWKKVGIAFPSWNVTLDAPVARNYYPNYQHELIYLFSNGATERGAPCEVSDDCSTDVWEVHQSQATRDVPGETNGRHARSATHGGSKDAAHPAVFPVDIPARLMRHLTARGESVLEPFCGAGSTVMAGEMLGRRVFAVEIEPRFVDVAVRRWETATGRASTLDATAKTFNEVAAERGAAPVTKAQAETPAT